MAKRKAGVSKTAEFQAISNFLGTKRLKLKSALKCLLANSNPQLGAGMGVKKSASISSEMLKS